MLGAKGSCHRSGPGRAEEPAAWSPGSHQGVADEGSREGGRSLPQTDTAKQHWPFPRSGDGWLRGHSSLGCP